MEIKVDDGSEWVEVRSCDLVTVSVPAQVGKIGHFVPDIDGK